MWKRLTQLTASASASASLVSELFPVQGPRAARDDIGGETEGDDGRIETTRGEAQTK